MSYADEFRLEVLPVIIYFMICDIVGFFGNISVIYVFFFHYQKNQYRLLVLALSIVDFTACCSTVPLEIITTWFWFDAPSTAICKSKNFFIMFIGLAAIYLLFVTAIYKYRRICKPFGRQVTEKMIIILCAIGMIFALIFGTPAAILFDINNHTVVYNNKSEDVFICEVHRSFHGTMYPAMYRHFVAVYCITMVTTIVLYIFVAKTTIAHVQKMRRTRQKQTTIKPTESGSTTSVVSQTVLSSLSTQQENGNKSELQSNADQKQSTSVRNSKRNQSEKRSASKEKDGPKSQLSAAQIRTVLIMMIIAGTFAVTFLMGLTFGYVFALRDNSDYSSTAELVFLFACYRLYFINYAMNPVVYFTLDRQFRKEVIKVFKPIATVCKK